MISGVCGGIAEYLSWDSTFVRILFVITTLLSFFSLVLVYFILALVMPE
jgi:phage shock protein PspC (stress-responsive transcriptional regulator)